MGCDIHLHVEAKINDRWEHCDNPSVTRWYELFTKMAGVRATTAEIAPISGPRGVPSDSSVITQIDYESWVPDAHSSSWLGRVDIVALCAWMKTKGLVSSDYFGYFLGSPFEAIAEQRTDGIEDVRFVFWFDN